MARFIIWSLLILEPSVQSIETYETAGFEVTVLPADASAEEARSHNPDAIFLSNGPGDPSALDYAHSTIRELIDDYPIFGICLGHQVLTHAIGASTYKLKFGHRGGNQPVKNVESEKVSITSQNHGFASDKEALEANGAVVTEYNLNDNTVSGCALTENLSFPCSTTQKPPLGPMMPSSFSLPSINW